jgi:uncharacterized membrane protein HdeD (DUF308 family)
MKKYIPIYLYGTIIILNGILLLFSKNSTVNVTRTTLGITSIVGATLAFMAALSRQRKQVQFAYQTLDFLNSCFLSLLIRNWSQTIIKS